MESNPYIILAAFMLNAYLDFLRAFFNPYAVVIAILLGIRVRGNN